MRRDRLIGFIVLAVTQIAVIVLLVIGYHQLDTLITGRTQRLSANYAMCQRVTRLSATHGLGALDCLPLRPPSIPKH